MFLKRRKRSAMAALILIILFYQLDILGSKYGDLFYTETFMPKQPLTAQYRKLKMNLDENGNCTELHLPTILCLIATSPTYHQSRAVHVAATWARHCTKTIFLTSQNDSTLPTAYVIPEAPGYDDLWLKVSKSFEKLYDENLMDKFDWVLKADDDSFIIVENLQKVLKSLNPVEPLAAGLKLKEWDTNEIYFNGGAGYVLSRSAVERLVQIGLRQGKCATNLKLGTNEDVNLSLCLQYLDVKLVELRDPERKRLFHIYPPQVELDLREATRWKHLYLKKISVDPYKFGFAELSDEPISFHYVDAETMYLLYYLVYVVNLNINVNKRQELVTEKAVSYH